MVWCGNCAKNISRPDYVDGKICCSLCGRVLDEDNFSQEPTFVKNAAGQAYLSYVISGVVLFCFVLKESQLSGNFVKTIQNEYSVSRERILNEAYNGIDSMIYALGIDGGDSIARPALAFYTFIKLSGGLEGGSEPPAFQRAERERIMAEEAAAQSSKNRDSSILNVFTDTLSTSRPHLPSFSSGATLKHNINHDSGNDRINADDAAIEESETLSDIDDIEDLILDSPYAIGFRMDDMCEEEKQLKKIIWEEMNKEYLEEQAAKEAAALAAKKAHEATFTNCSEDVQAAQKLAAAAAAAVAKSRKERQQKRAAEVKNSGPAQTAAEATRQMLDRKRLSSKIRYDVLEKLFDESENPETTKKSRTEADGGGDDKDFKTSKEENPEVEETHNTYSENVEEFDYDGDYNDFADF
ncbi:UNVERIFIED_CONTAM: hypothetical protein Scaly_2059200 [Sesamum calycinum]|uniref:Brf1 TBP-binding domain-containing protein n=1 Tax=Sesamum calycinum TaxID=2727403 RepID=A0AAW2N5W9_9LAMI